jgi:hypothetical protein
VGRLSRALAVIAAFAGGALLLSGDVRDDPRTPPPLPGLPDPFLSAAVIGSGGLTAAVDAYGSVVDLRLPGPAGRAQIHNPLARQQAGSVPRDTGIVVRAGAGTRPPLPLWRGPGLAQRYLAGTNVLRTSARVAGARVRIEDAIDPARPGLMRRIEARTGEEEPLALRLTVNLDLEQEPEGDQAGSLDHGFEQVDGRDSVRCTGRPRPQRITVIDDEDDARALLSWRGRGTLRATLSCRFDGAPPGEPPALAAVARADRRWLARASPLRTAAPRWARDMYRRSLLVLRALTDRRSGAVAAGARDGWAYVWPRDAGAAAIALAAAGLRREARLIAGFLGRLDLAAAARFRGDRSPVEDGRALPGDSHGWAGAAAGAAGVPAPPGRPAWRGRGDYGERGGDSGDYLANAIASGVGTGRLRALFAGPEGLARRAHDPGSGHDSAAAWAVRPFPRPGLFPLLRSELTRIAAAAGPFGMVPAQDWPGSFPWTAPTAWTAWSLATLGESRAASRLLRSLRRAATPAGLLPERVSDVTGVPDSTTPLAWSHAFALLALRSLYAPP